MIHAVIAGRRSRYRRTATTLAALAGLPLIDIETGAECERLLVWGDDHDLAVVAAHIAASGKPIAIAFGGAKGSLNDLFAISSDWEAALERLRNGTKYPFDLGHATVSGRTEPFVGSVVSGAGSRWRRGFPWLGNAGAVTVEGERTVSLPKVRSVAIMNTQVYRGLVVAPRAAAMDGQMDVQLFHGNPVGLLRLRRSLTVGLHERSGAVRRTRTAFARVEVPRSWHASADGISLGRGPLSVQLQTKAIDILI